MNKVKIELALRAVARCYDDKNVCRKPGLGPRGVFLPILIFGGNFPFQISPSKDLYNVEQRIAKKRLEGSRSRLQKVSSAAIFNNGLPMGR